jgi:hypothetical protein
VLGIDTTLTAMPALTNSFCAATASETSDPVAMMIARESAASDIT